MTKLSDCLGVTPNELLRGVREARLVPEEEPQALLEYTIEYAGRVSERKSSRRLKLAAQILSASIFLAAIICMICDLSINGGFTWVVFPVSALVFAWLVLMPPLCFTRQRLFLTLLSVSLFILPFLLVLCVAVEGNWFFPVAVPCTLGSLAYLWVVFFTQSAAKSGWYTGAVCFLLLPVLDGAINVVLQAYLKAPQFSGWDVVTAVVCIVAAAVLASVGKLRRIR